MGVVDKPHGSVFGLTNVLLGIPVKPQLDRRFTFNRTFVVPLLTAQQVVVRVISRLGKAAFSLDVVLFGFVPPNQHHVVNLVSDST